MTLRIAILLGAMLTAASGCHKDAAQTATDEIFAAYADLKLTSQTHDRELQAELALLQAERATPRLLDADRGVAVASSLSGPDLTHALNTSFTPSQLKFARQRSDALFARGVAEWNPLAIEQAMQFRAAHNVSYEQINRTLALPNAQLRLPLAMGLGLKTSFADAALIHVRLEAIIAAEHLAQGQSDSALAAIGRALRLVELLADEPSVVARLTAATARREALGAMQCFVNSRSASPTHLAQLERLISEQLAHWPPDADAWIGDRALGLCTYEMIHDGQLLSVLTEGELAAVRDDEGVENFAAAVVKSVDADETYYLQTMRRIIDASDQPYFERQKLQRSPESSIIADRLLLAGIEDGQRQQAADLALVRAWGIALAVASGSSLPPPEVNPLTGTIYDVRVESQRVVVANIDLHRPELHVSVPLAAQVNVSSRRGGATTSFQPR